MRFIKNKYTEIVKIIEAINTGKIPILLNLNIG